MNEAVKTVYNSKYRDFLGWTPSPHFRKIYELSVQSALNSLRRTGQIQIFEAGCGHGTWMRIIMDYLNGVDQHYSLRGIDISSERIKAASKYLKEYANFQLLSEDILKYKFEKKYDLIYSLEVFQYIAFQDQIFLLERWLEHLSPNGCIVIIDKDKYSFHSLLCEMQKRLGKFDILMWGFRRFSRDWRGVFKLVSYPDFKKIVKTISLKENCHMKLLKYKEFTALILKK